MQRNLVTRSRLVAATVLSLGGTIAATAVVPAPALADCARASVYLYRSHQGPDYVYGPKECISPDHGMNNNMSTGWGFGSDDEPYGTVTGAGFDVWVP